MGRIRSIEHEDLPAVASLYAELDAWDGQGMPGYLEFFERTLLNQPAADPEIPTLVYEEAGRGVVAFVGSHVRRFLFGGRKIRLACYGPLIVHPDYRRTGIATQLLRRFAEGPQEMTFNDRSIDHVRRIWTGLGGFTDDVASAGWRKTIAPLGAVADRVTRGRIGRDKVPGGGIVARIDGPGTRALKLRPATGRSEPLRTEALLDLLERLEPEFPLRPAYDDNHLSWLFETMEMVDLGRLVRRVVRADDGEPLGAYVMLLRVHGQASVVQVVAGADRAGIVLDHLIHDAAAAGAVELGGRVESHLLPHLAERKCRLTSAEWVTFHAADPALVQAVRSGRSLVTRMDGEWWMRPFPLGPPARLDEGASSRW